jgi:hypothetical protein
MKKLFFLPISLMILTGAIVAQSQQVEQKTQQNTVDKNDHFLMKDGKIVHIINGKEMQMQNNMTLKDGTMLNMDGSYKLKSGKQLSLHNGQCMDMDGRKFGSEHKFERNLQERNHGMNKDGKHTMHSDGQQHAMKGSKMH